MIIVTALYGMEGELVNTYILSKGFRLYLQLTDNFEEPMVTFLVSLWYLPVLALGIIHLLLLIWKCRDYSKRRDVAMFALIANLPVTGIFLLGFVTGVWPPNLR